MTADLLAMILLALSRLLQDVPAAACGVLLVATGALGFGFGTVVMALNTYAEEFSPGREDRAVLSLNALLGAGTALAPVLVAIFTNLGAWWLLPLTVAAAVAGLLLFSAGNRWQRRRVAGQARQRPTFHAASCCLPQPCCSMESPRR
jgi:MFS family permease